MGLLSKYAKARGKVYDAKVYSGNVRLDILVPVKEIKKFFTKDVELEKLRGVRIHMGIKKIKTVDKKKIQELEKQKQQAEQELKKSRS